MSEENLPIQSTKTLAKALIAACSIAVIIFVTVVLPAEYNIDPSGVGSALGLTVLAAPTPSPASNTDTDAASIGNREDETAIVIPANSGLEYKFFVKQYEELNYEWSSGSDLYFDLHGEPQGDSTGFFKSFAEATSSEMKGSIVAPFTGSHGWYWRNSSNQEVVVSLKTNGIYEIIGLK
ncbi:MAG: hypothetical protein ACJA2Q_000990 [Pseudohongiellaceae bacterium]|jgi:hypothetical protein